MARQVAIIHGWSDTSESFGPMVKFLRANGYDAVPVWLGDYISLEDDVRIEDVAKRMETVVREKMAAKELDAEFDLIVHSTGGLVARRWLTTYYPKAGTCPVRRLVMLAPANFGSKLAAMGQSMLGRVVKGWNNWFHTGKEMLAELELGSRFQWDLAQRDLFKPDGEPDAVSPYGEDGVLPFVIVGTHPYTDNLRQIVNENGGDGTVRACAANLNVRGITLDFSKNHAEPTQHEWPTRHDDLVFPCAVLPDRTHASVITPSRNEVKSPPEHQDRLGELILRALHCKGAKEYATIAEEWAKISEDTAKLAENDALRDEVIPPREKWFGLVEEKTPAEHFHQYLQVVVWVVDDHGADVTDFFLEFSAPERKPQKGKKPSTDEAVFFHSQVLETVHVNGPRRCLYVDRTDLVNKFYELLPAGFSKVLEMSVSATPPGDHVGYFSDTKDSEEEGATGTVPVHDKAGDLRWLQRNCTHFVKIIIPRMPSAKVFRLANANP